MSEIEFKITLWVDGEQVRDETVYVGEFDDQDEKVHNRLENAFDDLVSHAGRVKP